MRYAILISTLLFAVCVAVATGAKNGPAVNDTLPSNVVPTGKVIYQQYCASCHGVGAAGDGPYASMLKVRPADLTTLAKRHEGKFPYEYVADTLRFGPGPTILHGSPDMPAWGPIFQYLDKNDERIVEQRIKNLCNYLASLQEK